MGYCGMGLLVRGVNCRSFDPVAAATSLRMTIPGKSPLVLKHCRFVQQLAFGEAGGA